MSLPPASAQYPYPMPYPVRPPRRRSAADLIVTIVLLVVQSILTFIASTTGIFLGLICSGDSDGTCNGDLVSVGMVVAVMVVWLPLGLAIAAVCIFFVQRRTVFWMPIAGIGLMIVIWIIGFVLAHVGAGEPLLTDTVV